ncbi:MAG: ribulose-phosphate 3-epimerase [Candidatus Lokiarchaeota archaeon]|nr:ribulose-phosphate 3-epimerase [Candidatus Lokiarchaeota archaeon]
MDVIISPSILSADFAHLEEDIRKAEGGNPDYFHLDIMDGHFVPNISYGPIMAKTMKRITDKPLDAHLMITNPDKYIPDFIDAGVEIIYPQIEATYDIYRTVQLIVDLGATAGITLNPGTRVDQVIPLLDLIDYIMIMSVCPGFGGQEFIGSSIPRIRELRKILDDHKPEVKIAVDGGVGVSNIGELHAAGAEFFIAGSAIFKAKEIDNAIIQLREAAKGT